MLHTGTPGANRLTVTGATAILPDEVLTDVTIRIEDGIIAAIEQGPVAGHEPNTMDVHGAYVMPGVVDLHNDNLEHEINPRAEANLPLPFALSSMERRLAASGVTTEFHAISFQDNVAKSRSIADARGKASYLSQLEDDPRHGVRHHILHRLDVRTPDSLAQALPTLMRAGAPYASLNDHTPGQGQYRDVQRLIRLAHVQAEQRNGTKTDPAWYEERMRRAREDTETVQRFYAAVGERMATNSLVLSTHDDDTTEKVDQQLRLGATIAEFPVTFEAAQHSRAHGMQIVVGAPNIVRGGSQSGNLNAADLVARGLADIICADYHSPSLLPAAWRLVRDGLLDLPASIRMLTLNPARAVGLHDRGAIAVGLLADLCIVREDEHGWPHCEGTIIAGMSGFRFAHHRLAGKPRPALDEVLVADVRGSR